MNSFFHKIAVASIGIVLSFALGANKGAKAATFTLTNSAEFFITSTEPILQTPVKEFTNNMGDSFLVRNGRTSPYVYENRRGFYEFSISNLSLVDRAIFSIKSDGGASYRRPNLAIFGYIGNGKADLSDFEAKSLLDIQDSDYPDIINFDVTQFVNERVSNRDGFVGFAIAAFNLGTANIDRTYYPPVLIVETADGPESVPEPTTICGSCLALGVGGWLKRKKSNQQNKTTSQH
jgi:hypothetical protein